MGIKKKIIFIINDLRCGGAEKALVSLLASINYSQYEVDLFLFKKEGLFLNQVPPEVNILEESYEYSFFDGSFLKAFFRAILSFRFDIIYNRLFFSLLYKNENKISVREQKGWKYIASTITPLSKKYDLAVGFLENKPNYFCVDKVHANVKIGFIHNDYAKLELDPTIDSPYFDRLDYVATISEECRASLQRIFFSKKNKFIVVENISSPKLIHELALEPIESLEGNLKILTIGRLSPQKGYDLAIDAAKLLKEQNIDFKWYILGIGALQNELLNQVKKYQLEQYVVFLGLKENPYPYLKACDLYVQPSRFEGKSIAIDEAKILAKPILVTNFSTVNDQITHKETGYITAMNPEAIARGIITIFQDEVFRNHMSENLSQLYLGNEKEIEKIYKLIR